MFRRTQKIQQKKPSMNIQKINRKIQKFKNKILFIMQKT